MPSSCGWFPPVGQESLGTPTTSFPLCCPLLHSDSITSLGLSESCQLNYPYTSLVQPRTPRSCPSFERSASTRTISHANSTYTYSTHPEQSFHHNYSLRQESSNIWAESARCPYRSTVSSYNSPLTTFSHHTPSYPALNYYYHYPSYPMEVLLNRPASHQPVSSTSSSQHSAQPLHLNTSASSMLLNTNMTVSNPSRVASQPARFSHIPPFSADCAMLNFSSSMDGIFAAGSAPCSAPVMGHDESPAHSFPMSQIKQQPPSRTPTPSNNHDQALSQFNLMQPPNSRSFGGIGTGNGTGSATHLESDDRGTPITTTFSPNPLSSSAHNTTPPVLGNASMMGGVDSNITLWQFLFELLASNEHSHLLQWSNNDGEFKLIDAEAVARLWGARKGKPHMNYDKLSRALRYYYDKNIIRKVTGQKFVYRFVLGPNGLPQCGTSGTGHETSGIGSGGMLYAMSQMSRTNAMAAAAVASVVSDTAPEFRSPTTTARSTPDNHHPTPPNSSMQQPFMHPLQSAMGTETRRMSGATPPADRRTPRATPPSSSSSTTTSAPQQLAVSNSSCHGTGTPSPINSACSPSSTESSSGVSSAGTAVSSLSEMAMRSGENPIFAVPTTNTALRPPSNSSKPGSSRKRKNESMVPPPQHHLGGTNHHCRQSVGEIPSAFSRVMDGGRVEASRFSPLVDSNQQGQLPRHRDVASLMFNGDLSDSVTPGSTGSAKSSGQLGAAGSLSRRCIPKPLDLTAVNNSGSGGNGNGNNHCSTSTNNLNALNQITSSMNELMATAAVYSPLFSSASALNSHHQHLINQTLSPLVYAAASSLATGLVPPQSPLGQYAAQVLSASVLSAASPSLALYAAAVASPNVSQAPGLGLSAMWGNNGHSSLSTPICHRTPTQPLMAQALAAALASQSVQQSSQQHQHQQNQVFQFPPSALGTSLPTAITLAMLNGSSPHLHSPAIFGGALSTPSAHGKGGTNRSPDSLKTPIVNQPTVSLQEHVMELAANLRKG